MKKITKLRIIIKENLDFGMQLSQDEKGQLHGGFELQQVSFDDNSHLTLIMGTVKVRV